ncbi:MAG: TerB family tellurite resistance protein [Pseudomonadota bacterium]
MPLETAPEWLYVRQMLDKLLKHLSGSDPADAPNRDDAARTAIAAILVEAARADDVYLDSEREMIARILMERFGLARAAAEALRSDGEVAQAEAADLVRFTRTVKDAVPIEDRVGVIEAVWRVVYADENRDADESNLVRRLSGLLYVPDRDAGLARQRVVAALPG